MKYLLQCMTIWLFVVKQIIEKEAGLKSTIILQSWSTFFLKWLFMSPAKSLMTKIQTMMPLTVHCSTSVIRRACLSLKKLTVMILHTLYFWCVSSQFSRCLLWLRWSGPRLYFLSFLHRESQPVIGGLRFWQGNKKVNILRLTSHSVSCEDAGVWKWFWKTHFDINLHTQQTHCLNLYRH